MKKNLLKRIYFQQKASSVKRWHTFWKYTLDEFREWVLGKNKFHVLYDNRVKSWYKKELVPSMDRLDDYKGYSFENIQITTWGENDKRAKNDRRNGINTKISKGVIRIDRLTWDITEFYSIRHASRVNLIMHSNISMCCSGKRKTAWGYKWKFVD